MNITELQDRLTNLNITISNREISSIWGMDESSFSRKKREGSDIKHKNIQQLEAALNISLIDKTPTLKDINTRLDKMMGNKSENTVKIPYRPDVYLSAGYGLEVYSESAELVTLDLRLFTTDRGNKIKPENCEIVSISGNSMEPEYRHGDRVIIDRGDTEVTDGQIYAFRYKDNVFVKEINVLNDKLKCISLNKEYDPFYIKQGEEFIVYGRILPRIRL